MTVYIGKIIDKLSSETRMFKVSRSEAAFRSLDFEKTRKIGLDSARLTSTLRPKVLSD